jgi:ArsR family transcriptional regulator, cadmium/lead-responsive transcriptional repressor
LKNFSGRSARNRGILPLETRAKLFRGFCDPSRLSILEALRGGPRSVGEMVESTSLGQPNVSNHLSCLLDCGLVVREQRGRFGIYSLADLRGGTGDNDLLMAGIARSW